MPINSANENLVSGQAHDGSSIRVNIQQVRGSRPDTSPDPASPATICPPSPNPGRGLAVTEALPSCLIAVGRVQASARLTSAMHVLVASPEFGTHKTLRKN